MALPEHEQRILEQLEQQFTKDDPLFAQTMEEVSRPTTPTRHRVAGVLAAVTGLALLLFALTL